MLCCHMSCCSSASCCGLPCTAECVLRFRVSHLGLAAGNCLLRFALLHLWLQTLAERNKAYQARQEDQEAMQVVAGAVLPQEPAVAEAL